eukprot:TRINITY_DN2580_c5_g1_i1.p1 TRINITY_DN2580_c5_g1~~TRINITY_DN2580_c5_g1_i1.p1  ORF type:complete len:313 (-),score=55.76 TRINITY_DN2580_c5_g1_i1:81-1019(-)
MMLDEDDVGKSRPKWKDRLKGKGQCHPIDMIGHSLLDTPEEPPIVPKAHDLEKPQLGTDMYPFVGYEGTRRLKKGVFGKDGQVVNSQAQSSGINRPEGVRPIEHIPRPDKVSVDSKKCFDWIHRKTGYENPDQWEEPPVPGVRPSHPVSSNGVVALDRRKAFPEKQNEPTAIPPPKMCKAPFGAEWGGWGSHGAPGRRPLQGPWDSLQNDDPTSTEEAGDYRFCDSRTKRCPEMKYQDTFHLTRWHLDAKNDIDPIGAKRIHVNIALPSSARGAIPRPGAGKKSNMPVEGSGMAWYERIRQHELKATPLTAR